jgi:Holliday junction DNA helicase RuvB
MNAPALRLVPDASPHSTRSTATAEDPALRPTSFDDYIGQADVIANLRQSVRAAKRGGWQLDHMLFGGPAGLGKTSLAAVVAAELGGKFRATSAPAIEHKGALASLLTTLEDGDVLFIDEIHALDRAVAECLYSAMEDRVIDLPAGKRVIRVPLPKFTLLGATTHAGKLSKPLLDRFGFIWQLKPYTLPELATILARSARKLGVAIDEEGALAIAGASRGTPRIANRLLRRVRDVAANAADDGALVLGGLEDLTCANGTVNGPLVVAALAQLGIDHLGLDSLDRRYLAVVLDRPVGIEAICAELAEDRSTIEDAVEPFLMQAGLIKRGGKGRLATEAGRTHLAEVA